MARISLATATMPSAVPARLLRSHFNLIPLGLIVIVAYFQAAALAQLFAAAMMTTKHAAISSPALAQRVATATRRAKSAKAILARNVFDSTTGPIAVEPAPIQKVSAPLDPLSASSCSGIQARVVTESADRAWSVATLQGPGNEPPKLFRIGDRVTSKQVAFIGFNPKYQQPSVWLAGGTELCQARLFGGVGEQAATASAGNAERRAPAVEAKPLSEREKLFRYVRVIPETKDGEFVGFRLQGIRPDSMLDVLGLKNGDRVESINGYGLTSTEKALEALVRLRTAEKLRLQLVREQRPMMIDYEIR